MDIQRLITMANQIGDFYESYPDPAQAEQGIAEHINRFWALAMRQQIAQYVGQRRMAAMERAMQNGTLAGAPEERQF